MRAKPSGLQNSELQNGAQLQTTLNHQNVIEGRFPFLPEESNSRLIVMATEALGELAHSAAAKIQAS